MSTAVRAFSIGARLSAGFGIVVAIAIAMALTGYFKLHDVRNAAEAFTGDQLRKVMQLSSIKDNLNVVARGVRNIVLLNDAKAIQAERERIDEMRRKNASLMTQLRASIRNDEAVALFDAVQRATAPYEAAMDKAIAQALADDDATATQTLLKDVRPLQSAYFKAVDALVAHEQQRAAQAVDAIRDDASASGVLMLVLAALAAALGATLAFLIRRSVVHPLHQAVAFARTVASGDLSARVEVRRRDETGELLSAMNKMNDALIRLVGRVRDSSDCIATGSSQVATGAADLSQRTEEQASNLQQTAASMEQLNGSVRSSAETATQAQRAAEAGVDAAVRCGQAVDQVVTTMDAIAASSREVAEIIAVIDGIAFQTNILALNAAVEAARAGEQGRGFAVVATEVRTLAQRSATAAKDIKALIGRSVQGVETGTAQVRDAGASMASVVAEVRRISTMVAELSNAAGEQRNGLGQIGDAVGQLDTVTQQNAALVEQSSAAAESLSEQARLLAQLVRSFKLAEGRPLAAA